MQYTLASARTAPRRRWRRRPPCVRSTMALVLPAVIVASASNIVVDVNLDNVTHQLNPLFLGCHSDTGYAHQSRGLFSQLIIDESFETEQHGPPSPEPPAHCFPEHCRRMAEHWVHILPPGAQASFAIDPSLSMNGFKSAKMTVERGSAAIANRGQSGAGLYIEAHREYEGYFFAITEAGATVRASLYDRDSNASLGSSAPIHIATTAAATANGAGEKWTQYHFSLTTTGAAACTEVIRCSGEFRLEVIGKGSVNLDFVFLQPGEWGRFQGLSVLKSGADLLLEMGIKAVRVGGSFAGKSPWYEWKRWTGPIWKRPSVGVRWGNDLIAGWGPFDFINFANHAGIEPVFVTTSTTSVEDFAELIEYCWGNSSTAMGKQRAADGHPAAYRVRFFALGNEGSDGSITKDGQYVEQVVAMEAKAKEIGKGGELYYLFPSGGQTAPGPSMAYAQFLSPHDLSAAAKAVQAGQIKAEQMVDSIHTGHHPYYWGGGAAGLARHLFEEVSRSQPSLRIGAVNTETNAKQQSQNRAMMEGGDLNDWLGNTLDITDRIHMRCSSFCMGQGDNSDEAGFVQSIAEFLPNGTFLQPPGHVHAMVAKTWQPNGLATTLSGIDNSPDLWGSRWNKTVTASASASNDGKAVTIRLHSNSTTALTVQINLKSKHAPELSLDAADAVASMLAAPSLSSVNTPAAQDTVVPRPTTVRSAAGGGLELAMLPHSFATLTVQRSRK